MQKNSRESKSNSQTKSKGLTRRIPFPEIPSTGRFRKFAKSTLSGNIKTSIEAFDLFSLFTADIIKNELFCSPPVGYKT